jgi:hypothetical protein
MTKQSFLKITRSREPHPSVYVDGIEHKIDHVHGENIIMTNGIKRNYRHVANRFFTSDLPVRIYEAIRLELLDRYQFGNESLDAVQVGLSEKYGISQSAVKRISDNLTISDFKEYQQKL